MSDLYQKLTNAVFITGLFLWTFGGALFLSSALYRYIRIFIVKDDIAVLDSMLSLHKQRSMKYYNIIKKIAKEAHTDGDSCYCAACYAWENLTEDDKKNSITKLNKRGWRFW